MDGDEQKPDPSLLKLQHPSMLCDASLESNRTLSFKVWMVERAASQEGVASMNAQSSKTQTPPPGLLMIKDEPWQGPPPGMSRDEHWSSAARDLSGRRNKSIIPKRPRLLQGPPGISRNEHLNPPCNKVQTHPPPNETIIPKRPRLLPQESWQGPPPGISRDEHLNPPYELPFSRANPSPRPNQFQELKLLPNTIVPSRPRSFLKRKATPGKPATPPPPPSKMRKSAENLVCHLCQVSCSSALVMQQHLKGRQHKAKISYMKMKRESATTTAAKPRCDLCEIWCPDMDALQMHFKGQKHKAKYSFEQHLKGRQHGVKQDLKCRGLL
ncbi:hypothetical protein AAHA92_31829 [Salvia divinorum]|uniref:C2H2-type domain-containing protein n=1 Tax=Salvia divinorum TaxID=28513 RepID=A0ABD1FJ90_SALDI